MPVRRLRDLADAEEAAWLDPRDPALWRRIAAVWELAARLAPRRFPCGVHKHRSIAEANQQTAAWEAEHVAALRTQRGG